MYNKLLDTFIAAAECGSFSATARKLYISPSAVSQKITELETELGVPLFHRTTQGVDLTEQGKILLNEAYSFRDKSIKLRQTLLAVDERKTSICVGTSLAEKCRLLFDLWMRYRGQESGMQIILKQISGGDSVHDGVELVECVKDDAPWQKGWSFIRAGTTPLRLFVNTGNPMYGRERLDIHELEGTTVVIVERSRTHPLIVRLCAELESSGVRVLLRPDFGAGVVWECCENNYGMILPACMQDAVMDMYGIPVKWEYALPYGFFYREPVSKHLRHFLSFAEKCVKSGDTIEKYRLEQDSGD